MRFLRNSNLLATVVLLHLGVAIAHAIAHVQAQVALSPAALSFVLIIFLAGPVLGY